MDPKSAWKPLYLAFVDACLGSTLTETWAVLAPP